MKALIVEDDKSIAEVLCIYLDILGHVTYKCANTIELAIEVTSTFKPDVILLDLLIGGEHATSVIDIAREANPNAKIYILSAMNGAKLIAEKNNVGYISKPFALETIEQLLKVCS